MIYETIEGGTRTEDRVHRWEKSQVLRSGKYRLWDYCFELPGKNLEAVKPTLDSVQVGTVTHKLKVGGNDQLEIYDYPGGYAQRFDGVTPSGGDRASDVQNIFQDNARTVGIRMQEETAASMLLDGSSTCRQLGAGCKFTLDRHFNGNGAYVVTRVEHLATAGDAYTMGSEDSPPYTQHVPVHPRRAAVPARADDPAPPDRRDPDGRRRRQFGGRDLHRQVRADQGPVPLGPPGPEQRRQLVLDPRRDPLGGHPVGYRSTSLASARRSSSPSRKGTPTGRSSSAASTTPRRCPPTRSPTT